jgi:hypothetical protein
MQAMNTYADGGVVPLVPKLCTGWTWASSLSACFAPCEEYLNPVNKTLAVLQKRYVLRKALSYLTTGQNHLLPNSLNFLQPDHQLTYFTHCINTADDKILLQFSITLYIIFELDLKNKEMTLLKMTENFTLQFLNIHIKLWYACIYLNEICICRSTSVINLFALN